MATFWVFALFCSVVLVLANCEVTLEEAQKLGERHIQLERRDHEKLLNEFYDEDSIMVPHTGHAIVGSAAIDDWYKAEEGSVHNTDYGISDYKALSIKDMGECGFIVYGTYLQTRNNSMTTRDWTIVAKKTGQRKYKIAYTQFNANLPAH